VVFVDLPAVGTTFNAKDVAITRLPIERLRLAKAHRG